MGHVRGRGNRQWHALRKSKQSGMVSAGDVAACLNCGALVGRSELCDDWCLSCVVQWGHPEDASMLEEYASHGWTSAGIAAHFKAIAEEAFDQRLLAPSTRRELSAFSILKPRPFVARATGVRKRTTRGGQTVPTLAFYLVKRLAEARRERFRRRNRDAVVKSWRREFYRSLVQRAKKRAYNLSDTTKARRRTNYQRPMEKVKKQAYYLRPDVKARRNARERSERRERRVIETAA